MLRVSQYPVGLETVAFIRTLMHSGGLSIADSKRLVDELLADGKSMEIRCASEDRYRELAAALRSIGVRAERF